MHCDAVCCLVLNSAFSTLCFLGPEADGIHPGSAEPAGERHQADGQPDVYGQPAAERGGPPRHRCSWCSESQGPRTIDSHQLQCWMSQCGANPVGSTNRFARSKYSVGRFLKSRPVTPPTHPARSGLRGCLSDMSRGLCVILYSLSPAGVRPAVLPGGVPGALPLAGHAALSAVLPELPRPHHPNPPPCPAQEQPLPQPQEVSANLHSVIGQTNSNVYLKLH